MLFRFFIFFAVVANLWPLASQGDELPGRVVVKVSVQGSGTPVRAARIRAHRGDLAAEDRYDAKAEPLTDENGRYELPVNWGNVRLLAPLPPRGFWMIPTPSGVSQFEQLVVTREQPTVERSFEVSEGVVWPVKVATAQGQPLPGVRLTAHCSADRSQGGGAITDAQGKCDLTLPLKGGKLSVGFYQQELGIYPHGHVSLEIAPSFDPAAVVSQTRSANGNRVELVDQQGRMASWEGCTVVLEGGAAQVVFVAGDPPGPSLAGEIAGTVVDQQGQAIQDATVTCVSQGLPSGIDISKTDERGGFRVRGYLKWTPPDEKPGFRLVVGKEGYAGIEATHFFQSNANGLHQLERPLLLAPAHSIRLRVLNQAGQPVEGAWVERFAGNVQISKSDREGYCTLGNLPAGNCELHASYGEERATAKVTTSPATASAAVVDIRLAKPGQVTSIRKSLNVSEPAPEWSIREWTDGKAHTLAALRGRVVVIDFWSIGCTPCRTITLPVMNRLHPRFASKDVSFVNIHSAGVEMHVVKELMALQHWDFLVGLDQGDSETDSETNQRYGVRGLPTVVIVGRQGRVAFHSGDDDKERIMAAMKATAEEIGLPWPVERDATQDEVIQRLQRLHEHWMTKEIEKALAKE